MAGPRPSRPNEPTDEPGWWIASDGRWYPPESKTIAPEGAPTSEELRPISWSASAPESSATPAPAPVALPADPEPSLPVETDEPETTTAPSAPSDGPAPARIWKRPWFIVVAVGVVIAAIIAAVALSDTKDDARDVESGTRPAGTQPAATSSTVPPTSPARGALSPTDQPGFSGDGVFVVGQDVQPGLYVSSNNSGCYWQRATDASGGINSIIQNANVEGQGLVQLNVAEVFQTQRCARWIPFAASEQLQTFGDGTWVVTGQVPPGRWQSNGAGDCYWARLASFGGGVDSIAANANVTGPTIVDISTADAGFETARCGAWTKVG